MSDRKIVSLSIDLRRVFIEEKAVFSTVMIVSQVCRFAAKSKLDLSGIELVSDSGTKATVECLIKGGSLKLDFMYRGYSVESIGVTLTKVKSF